MFRTTVGKTVLNLTLATSAIYGGGVALSLKNDAFNELFTDNVPLAEDIVDYIQSFETTKKDYNIQNFKEKFGELEKTLDVPKSGLIAQKVDSIKENLTKKVSKDDEKSSTKQVENVIQPKIQLKPIELKAQDPKLQKVITEFNSLIGKINNGSTSNDDSFVKIVESIGDLDKNLNVLQQKQNEELTSQIKEAIAKKEKEVLNSFTDEFNSITKRIEKQHQDKLIEEISQKTKVISAHYENIVKTNQINATRQFTELIEKTIENEREGKYSKFNELNSKLENLQKLVLTIDSHLNNSELKSKLQLSLNKLKNKLNSNKNENFTVEIAELNKLAKESENKVIASAINSIDPETIKTGLLTNSQIISRFHLLIPELRSASLLPPNAGLLGHLSSLLFSKFLLSKEGHVEGKDIESVISRVDNYLISNQLDDAVEEIANLKGWNRKLADDWLIESRKRLEVEFLVNLIDLESRTLF
ncbi:putative secreted protein [Wickerhamomyces ciferrii]|uniref:MICOS complex subunit MIC60 n=1 Tax=Wickerhamomyces ciferrii (strain ATCC 14091 / BCRC 22168 / CBS 111 / JCM 3599 / NBRC 0793 / NRRL Y-1031 F-60-10) TaxID=1206466 RepID=K0KRK6_WICCF|nr:uncharacterized protein BN7_3489 [Wickerhamomyces ciferrii]CCH43934.1 putative secreted protein [Wickerhamomyces ciferrii]